MEIRVLRYFLAVAREGGINRAAEVLHGPEPTLSRQLSALEEDLGVRLFERGARTIVLTNEGLLLRRRAEEILSLVDRTEKELIEQDELTEGHIVFGCGELAAVGMLPEIISSFHRKFPRVTYDLFTATADLVKEQMEKGLVDIGVLLEPVDIEKYDFIRLRQKERWQVMMRPDDPLAGREAVSAQDLSGKPLILPMRNNVRNALTTWFGETLSEDQILFTSNLSTNAALMVQAGLGYAVTVEGSHRFWDERKIASRPLTPEIFSDSVFAWKRNQPSSPAVSWFVQEIRAFCSDEHEAGL